eukprot:m.196383 g.196383  ORF g.196383 m.196383 type:complete len:177 (+) comp18690_c0_seq9:220-750(+)
MSINKLEKYIFVGCMATMSITAMVFEPYVVFDENGTALTQDALDSNPSDIVRHLWAWYAKSFDPIFLETPLFLRIMCGVDMAIFGPLQAAIGFALWTERLQSSARWRLVTLMYASAIVYSTVIYFAVEVIQESHRADMLWVVVINVPYTIVPLLLAGKVWQMEVAEDLIALQRKSQ